MFDIVLSNPVVFSSVKCDDTCAGKLESITVEQPNAGCVNWQADPGFDLTGEWLWWVAQKAKLFFHKLQINYLVFGLKCICRLSK